MTDFDVILDGAAAIYVADEVPGAGETIDLEDGVRADVGGRRYRRGRRAVDLGASKA